MTFYALRDTPRARAQVEILERLAWLYGDAAARMEANQPDVQAWRKLGWRQAIVQTNQGAFQ